MFTETEQRFLRRENAIVDLKAMPDLRELGCPEHIYTRVLESRAQKLGTQFVREAAPAPIASHAPSLEQQIDALKLF